MKVEPLVSSRQRNRLKHLVAKAEKQYYAVNVKLTMLHDILYNIRKEIQYLEVPEREDR